MILAHPLARLMQPPPALPEPWTLNQVLDENGNPTLDPTEVSGLDFGV
jgi:hypothetical protein